MSKNLMTKQEIELAVAQLKEIKRLYPAFYKLHCMIMDLGDNKIQEMIGNEKG